MTSKLEEAGMAYKTAYEKYGRIKTLRNESAHASSQIAFDMAQKRKENFEVTSDYASIAYLTVFEAFRDDSEKAYEDYMSALNFYVNHPNYRLREDYLVDDYWYEDYGDDDPPEIYDSYNE